MTPATPATCKCPTKPAQGSGLGRCSRRGEVSVKAPALKDSTRTRQRPAPMTMANALPIPTPGPPVKRSPRGAWRGRFGPAAPSCGHFPLFRPPNRRNEKAATSLPEPVRRSGAASASSQVAPAHGPLRTTRQNSAADPRSLQKPAIASLRTSPDLPRENGQDADPRADPGRWSRLQAEPPQAYFRATQSASAVNWTVLPEWIGHASSIRFQRSG